jgi:hypothetical protein
MLEPDTHAKLARAVEACVETDRELLDALRREIAPLKASMR